MTGYEVILAWISIATPLCGAIAWGVLSLNKKFDKIDAKIDRIQIDITKLNIRVAHIEGAYFGKELPKHVAMGDE